LIYFVENMLQHRADTRLNKTTCISGARNVALHTAEKATALGAKVVTLSDSSGFIHDPDGIDQRKINCLKAHKAQREGSIAEFVTPFPAASFHLAEKPWQIPCDRALPCATQTELDLVDAQVLINNGVILLIEGANIPGFKKVADAMLTFGIV
jgi:glutamate dehydrogenase (NADP+)